MSKEYDAFVENLRQLLLERLGLKEEQIFFKEQDEQGMTPSGDRLFVECHASPAGKEVSFLMTMRTVCLWRKLQTQWKKKSAN